MCDSTIAEIISELLAGVFPSPIGSQCFAFSTSCFFCTSFVCLKRSKNFAYGL